ncbi:MAG: rod shape-determining protein MreC [Actinobacteria bacterium HGW-Actinobacteria-7]|jgi:rod shape-determining protein MreC|nr:MAG: rod shape-determining protein MreC [Actinobacteria bacterium HGW-Actinobacteria-7]
MRLPGNETPRSRPGWLILFVALAIVITTAWYREADTGLLHKTRSVVQASTAPVSAAGEWATRPARGFISWVTDLGVSRSQLEQLRAQNQRLRSRVSELEEARIENIRLRKLVKITQAGNREAVAASVIGRPSNQWENAITIDRGTADGIKVGMPVVGPRGLLGQTVSVSARSSRVRLLTDQRSGVAALVQRTRAAGIVKGSIDGHLSLEFVSTETTVRAGDVVITSGIGGVYPKGLIVGEAIDVKREPNALFQTITLEPAGGLAGLEEVLVLTGAPPAVLQSGGE